MPRFAAGHGITLSAPAWLEGVAGIVWRPLSDVRIEIRPVVRERDDPAAALRCLAGASALDVAAVLVLAILSIG